MLKKNSFRILALLTAMCMLLPLSACKKQHSDGSSSFTSTSADTSDTDSTKASDGDKSNSSAVKDNSSGNKSAATTTKGPKIDNTKPKTSLSRDEVMAKMPANLRGTTIKYMYWWNPKEQMEKTAIADFEKATGITVEPIVGSYAGFYQQVAAKIASGDSPDIIRLMSNLDNTVDSLQPVTNSGFDFNDTAWDSQLLSDYTFNGNCYAVNLKNSAVMDYAVIYYNKNALKAAEMEDPYTIWKNNPEDWTWSKFWKMCQQFVKANGKSSDTYYGATFEYPDAYVRAMGGAIYTYDSAKGKFKSGVTSNAMKVGWQRTCDAISKKWLIQKHDVSLFDSGKILFYWSGPYSVRVNDERQKELKAQNALGIVPLPTDSKNQTVYEYTAFGIPKGAKNAAAAPYYLRWVLDQSSYDMRKVWVNDEAYNVMQAVSSNEKLFYGSYWYEAFFNDMYQGGSQQVKSVQDSYKNVIDMYAKQQNERIALY